jgi:hypothetical protein
VIWIDLDGAHSEGSTDAEDIIRPAATGWPGPPTPPYQGQSPGQPVAAGRIISSASVEPSECAPSRTRVGGILLFVV